jgi:hypothetical protein
MDLEHAEIAGYVDVFRAAPAALAREHGISYAEIGGAACTAVDALPGARMFNHVMGLGANVAALDPVLDAVAEHYGGRSHYVALSPGARPAGLGERFADRGFTPDYGWMKFRRGVEPPEPVETALRIEPARREHAADFGRIVAAGFELPPFAANWLAGLVGRPGWTCLVAFDGDDPAATGALYVDGDVGWLSLGATLPEHRRKGAQGALLAERIRIAPALGCTALVTETGEAVEGRPSNSYRNILRAGFAEAFVRPNLRSP